MSASFLTTKIANMLVAVEAAFGADLTDLTGASWTWSDITADVLLQGEDGISITLGRPDFSQETQGAEMTCELDNRDGEWSQGGLSPHWPNLKRGTPIRVRVSNNGGTNWYVRFQGGIVSLTPHWDKTGRWATTTLAAAGPLRRINQGTEAATSVYAQLIPTDTAAYPGLQFYWNNEGGNGMNAIPSVVPKAEGMNVLEYALSYLPQAVMGADTSAFPVSGPLPGQFSMDVNSTSLSVTTSTGNLQFRAMYSFPGIPDGTLPGSATLYPETQPLFNFVTSASSTVWTVEVHQTGALRLINDAGYTGTAIAFAVNGSARLLQLQISSGGAYQIATLKQDGVGNHTNQSASGSIGRLTDVWWNAPNINSPNPPFVVGHMTVQNQLSSHTATAFKDLFHGMPGETSQARLTRLAAAAQIPLTVVSSADVANASVIDALGPQYYDTFTNLLRECERTGQGLLYDGLDPGLTYVTKRRRETNANSAPTLTLDASAGHLMEPFEPTDDDQQAINRCDVSRRNASVVTHTDLTGPLGVHAIGEYASSVEVNTDDDIGLIRYGEWMVNLGTREGYRYPSVSFALETNSGLIPGWLACIPTSRVDVTNITAIRRQHPDHTIKLLLEGWEETITAFTWRVTANTSAAEPWNVIVLAAATGSTGDGVGRLQTESSQLNANYTSGTTISVRTNTGVRWITTSEDADSFPFDIDVGGVKATVTGITSTTSPQTFTLSAALPRTFTGSTTAGAGTPVKVWRPPVYGL
jgi:hypothetical protein